MKQKDEIVATYRRIGASFIGEVVKEGTVIWQGTRRPIPGMAKADAEAAIRQIEKQAA